MLKTKGLSTWTQLTGLAGYRDKFRLGFISAWFPRWETAKDPGDEFWLPLNSRKKANMAKHKNVNFRAYQSFGNP